MESSAQLVPLCCVAVAMVGADNIMEVHTPGAGALGSPSLSSRRALTLVGSVGRDGKTRLLAVEQEEWARTMTQRKRRTIRKVQETREYGKKGVKWKKMNIGRARSDTLGRAGSSLE